MMDADDLVLFDAIISEGGLSAAARRLGLPKATVSRRLIRLEAAVGVPLFDRFGRKLRLTQAGEVLRGPSKTMGIALSEARSLAKAAMGPTQGLLRIVSPFLFGKLVLSPFLGRFLAEREHVTAVVRFDNSRIDPLRDNVDLAIRIGQPSEPYLITSRLASATLGLYAPPALAARVTTCDDLANLPFVQVSNDHTDEAVLNLRDGDDVLSQRVKVCCTVNDPEAACTISAGGAGFSVLPTFLAGDFVARGSLVPVLPRLVMGNVDIFALLPPGRNAIPVVAEFLKSLRQQIGRKGFQ